jgi:ribonuclease HI
VVLIHPKKTRELSGSNSQTTNNRMELTAVIEALKTLRRPCEIDLYTDSQYVRKGITEWVDRWAANGWQRGKKEAVLNADLWQALHRLVKQHDIHWHWVKGHAGNPHNERADALASAAIPRAEQPGDPAATRVYLRIAGPKGTQGCGGWAAAIVRGDTVEQVDGCHPKTTANHLAIHAARQALAHVPEGEQVQCFTNNSYLYDGITHWVEGWRQSGWVKRTDGKPVKYRDDWEALDRASRARGVTWVRFRDQDAPEVFKQLKAPAEEARDACT